MRYMVTFKDGNTMRQPLFARIWFEEKLEGRLKDVQKLRLGDGIIVDFYEKCKNPNHELIKISGLNSAKRLKEFKLINDPPPEVDSDVKMIAINAILIEDEGDRISIINPIR